jgi:hypothetical protein
VGFSISTFSRVFGAWGLQIQKWARNFARKIGKQEGGGRKIATKAKVKTKSRQIGIYKTR